MHCISGRRQSSASFDGELQKQGFTRKEGNGDIRKTWEIDLVPMEDMISPQDDQGTAFV